MGAQVIQVYLTVRGGMNAIKWYETTWGAKQISLQMADDETRVLHATLEMFDGYIMLSDEFPEFQTYVKAPPSNNGTSVTIHITFSSREAVDQAQKAAEDAGAQITMPAAQMPWGAYYGRIVDPFGHSWSFSAE